jgi:carboxypeptidase C (cathepsin A)
MKKMFLPVVLVGFLISSYAQTTKTSTPTIPTSKEENSPSNLVFNPDSQVITNHVTTIKGQKVPFKATTGTMPVWDEEGKALAGIFYTYYERSDIKNNSTRPLVISGHINFMGIKQKVFPF